ncbi:unnamed protein product [Acanthocheilonema viteae]|uniref:Uncharacterized protein n=1 Tax=Acanthocheilonema viteae TaxID=6277 RepID=A0A498SM59_ACAVI|nr:unnamed protein product [Acanthocheilonema viteae]
MLKFHFWSRRFVAGISALPSSISLHYIRFLNAFIRTGLGTGLYCLVHFLLVLIVGCEYLILFPYEQQVRPSFRIPVYYAVGAYLIVCILFHYQKACSVDPGRPEFATLISSTILCSAFIIGALAWLALFTDTKSSEQLYLFCLWTRSAFIHHSWDVRSMEHVFNLNWRNIR